MQRVLNLLKRIGFDRALLYALTSKGWAVIERPITLTLIATCMTAQARGFYFTFASVLALGVFFELGIGVVLTQFYGHEAAYFRLRPDGTFDGSWPHIDRFRSLLRQAFKWYCGIAILVVVCIGTAGAIFFGQRPSEGVSWTFAWWGVVVVSATTAPLQPFISALEGMGLVAEVQRLRLASNVLGGLLLWGCLLLRGGLLASWCLPLGGILCTSALLSIRYRPFIKFVFARDPLTKEIKWWEEIWPMQWKIAVSWISGYFISQLFAPVLFRFQGPVIAGRMGMSMAVGVSVMAVGVIPIVVKAPFFAQLISKRDYLELDKLFRRSGLLSLGMSAIATIGAITIIALFNGYTQYGDRFLPTWQVVCLIITYALLCIPQAQAIYLRAHKQEPFLMLNVVGGIATGLVAVLGGIWYSSAGQCLPYLLVTVMIGLPWSTYVFYRCRREWHKPAELCTEAER